MIKHFRRIITALKSSRFVRALVSYSAVIFITKALNFVFQFVVSRSYGPASFGEFSLFQSYQNMLAFVVGMNLMSSFSILKPGMEDQAFKDIVKSNYLINSIIFAIVPFAALPLQILFLPGSHSPWFGPFCYISAYGYQSLFYYLNYQLFEREYRSYSRHYLTWGAVQNVVLLIVAYLDRGKNINVVIAIAAFGNLCLAVPVALPFLRGAKPNFAAYWETVRVVSPLMISSLASAILAQNDRVLIGRFEGLEKVGIYSFAANIGMMVYLLNTTINKAWAPEFIERMRTNRTIEVAHGESRIILLYGIFSIAFSAITFDISKIIGGNIYTDSHRLAKIFVLAQFLSFLYALNTNYLFYKKRTLFLSSIVFVNVIVNIALNYIMIPRLGFMSAAYNSVIAYTIAIVATRFYIKKKLDVKLIGTARFYAIIAGVIICTHLIDYIERSIALLVVYWTAKIVVIVLGQLMLFLLMRKEV